MRNWSIFTSLTAICFIIAGCVQSNNDVGGKKVSVPSGSINLKDQSKTSLEGGFSEASFLEALGSKDFDRVIRAMNEVKRASYSGHLVPLLVALWKNEIPRGVDEGFVNHPRIRIEIADVLAQMERNGFQGLDKLSFAKYARELVDSNDPQVARQAILVLGIAGNIDDVLLLEKLAKDGSVNKFRPAVAALSENCATTNALIARLEEALKEKWQKEFVSQVWQQSQQIRTCTRR